MLTVRLRRRLPLLPCQLDSRLWQVRGRRGALPERRQPLSRFPDVPSLPDGPAVGAQANAACFARVANGWTFSAVTVGTQFNQTQYLIQPGDTALVSVPGPSTMCIWECIWNGASYDCRWDCGYTICPDGLYRVTQSGPLTISLRRSLIRASASPAAWWGPHEGPAGEAIPIANVLELTTKRPARDHMRAGRFVVGRKAM